MVKRQALAINYSIVHSSARKAYSRKGKALGMSRPAVSGNGKCDC
jgi:hypothetical protein